MSGDTGIIANGLGPRTSDIGPESDLGTGASGPEQTVDIQSVILELGLMILKLASVTLCLGRMTLDLGSMALAMVPVT
jgi:hypothetical protein